MDSWQWLKSTEFEVERIEAEKAAAGWTWQTYDETRIEADFFRIIHDTELQEHLIWCTCDELLIASIRRPFATY